MWQKLQQLSFFDTFKEISTYFTGTMLIHALGLITLPIFTYFLDDAEYGIINTFSSWIVLLTTLCSLNLHWAIDRYYYEEKKDFAHFLGGIILSVAAIFGLLGGILFYFKSTFANYINLPEHTIPWLLASVFGIIIWSSYELMMIAQKRSMRLTRMRVTWQYLKFALSISGLYFLSKGTSPYIGKIAGDTIATLLIVLYAFREVKKNAVFKLPKRSHLSYALSYSLPLIPFALSNHIMTAFDQIYINATIGQAESGLYSFAYKIGVLYVGLNTALIQGAAPAYYKLMNEKKYKEVNQQADSMLKLLCLGGIFLILFAIDIGTLLSAKASFVEALPLAPIIIGAYFFNGIASFYNRGIYYIKRNAYLAGLTISCGILNVGLNIYFLKIYGYQAAAYTTLASYGALMLVSIFITTRILKLPGLPISRILKYIVLLGIIVGSNYLIGAPNIGMHWGWIFFKGSLFILATLILFLKKIRLLLQK